MSDESNFMHALNILKTEILVANAKLEIASKHKDLIQIMLQEINDEIAIATKTKQDAEQRIEEMTALP